MAERQVDKVPTGPGETHPPPMTAEHFRASADFRRFKDVMKQLLRVTKQDLDRMLTAAKERSPRTGNPNAPGRKPTAKRKGHSH